MEIDWKLEGTYFEACNCAVACPCVWLAPPTEGHCELLVGWRIERGHYRAVRLDDLNVVLACESPGHMRDGNWRAALYLDQRIDAAQEAALVDIFGGKAGGHPALLMSFVGEVRGVRKVPIVATEDGRRRSLRIPEVAELEIAAIDGIGGGDATVFNPPLCIAPSHPAVVARSSTYRYHDYGWNWEISDRNGYYSPFVYQP